MSSRALIRVLSQIFCCFGAFYLVRAENTTVPANVSEIVLCPKNDNGQTCDDIIDPLPTLITCEDLTQNQGYDCRGCRCGAPKTTTVIATTNATTYDLTFVTNATIVEPRIPSNCTFDFETAPNSTLVSLFVLPILWVILICLAIFADIFLKCCCDKKAKKSSSDEDEGEDDQLSLRARVEKTMFEYSHMGKMLFFSVKRTWQKFNKRNQPPPKPEAPVVTRDPFHPLQLPHDFISALC